MKVLINALSLKPRMGGGLTFGLGLARALGETAGAHEVVLLGHDRNAGILESSRCAVHRVASDLASPAKRILFENTALPGRVARIEADVYISLDGIVPGRMNAATVAILQNALYFNRTDVISTHTVRGHRRIYLNLQARYFLSGWRRTARYADACVFVSDSLRTDFIARYPRMAPKSHVVWEAPAPAFSPGTTEGGGGAYLLAVGTLYPYKRFDLLIQLLAEIPACPELRVRIAGPDWGGERSRLQELARSLGVADRVEFLGHRTEEELVRLYRGALCVCMFSDFEAFGLPLVEAMACGTPALAARRSAMPEVGHEAIFTADTERLEPFARHIQRLWNDGAYRTTWAARALQRASLFRWSAIASAYWKLIEQLPRARVSGCGEKSAAPPAEEKVL